MNRETYLAQRDTLMNEAQNLIGSGSLEEAGAKMKEVEALDAQYEASARAQANFNALNEKMPANGMQAMAKTGVSGVPFASLSATGTGDDRYDSAEYKAAFMNYVMRGTELPEAMRNEAGPTKTGDAGVAIPTTTLQKIYEKMETIGTILPLVTHTAYKGGLSVPLAGVKPVASWVAEGAGSDNQKVSLNGAITFGYHKLRCAVSMTYEVENMAYPMFETFFVNAVSQAMVKAKEAAIINGSGSAQPKGILRETAVESVTAAGALTYEQLLQLEGAQEYEGAVWAMTRKTFMGKILGMVDKDGQPIARTNVGINGRPEYTLLGRRVVFLHPDYLVGTNVAAFMFDFGDYVWNAGVSMATKRYYDETVDDTVLKAVEVCDGKAVRTDSLITVTTA